MSKKTITKKGMCEVMADKIYQTNLTKEELKNTLIGLYVTAETEGYMRRLHEEKNFRNKMRGHKKIDFDKIRDGIEDKVHGGLKPKQS